MEEEEKDGLAELKAFPTVQPRHRFRSHSDASGFAARILWKLRGGRPGRTTHFISHNTPKTFTMCSLMNKNLIKQSVRFFFFFSLKRFSGVLTLVTYFCEIPQGSSLRDAGLCK